MLTRKVLMLITAMLMVFSAPLYAANQSVTVALSDAEKADLLFMREEEKVARDTYLTFDEQWHLKVFSDIAKSEQKHMDAILKLLNKYNLPDPAEGNAIGVFDNLVLQALYTNLIATGSVSALDALKVGGLIEEKDMLDIKAAIERSQQDDIDAVYESLLCGSRNHLRSFVQNIVALTTQPYVAQILDQAEVDAIIASPMENCGKKGLPGKQE